MPRAENTLGFSRIFIMTLSSVVDLLAFALGATIIVRGMYHVITGKKDSQSSQKKHSVVTTKNDEHSNDIHNSRFGGASFCNTPADTCGRNHAEMWD